LSFFFFEDALESAARKLDEMFWSFSALRRYFLHGVVLNLIRGNISNDLVFFYLTLTPVEAFPFGVFEPRGPLLPEMKPLDRDPLVFKL